MTPDNLRDTLSRLGLSQAEASRLLGVDKASVTRWVHATVPVPAPIERLLWLLGRPTLGPEVRRVIENKFPQ